MVLVFTERTSRSASVLWTGTQPFFGRSTTASLPGNPAGASGAREDRDDHFEVPINASLKQQPPREVLTLANPGVGRHASVLVRGIVRVNSQPACRARQVQPAVVLVDNSRPHDGCVGDSGVGLFRRGVDSG